MEGVSKASQSNNSKATAIFYRMEMVSIDIKTKLLQTVIYANETQAPVGAISRRLDVFYLTAVCLFLKKFPRFFHNLLFYKISYNKIREEMRSSIIEREIY